MSTQQVTLDPTSAPQADAALGFFAQSVTVDNFTNEYVQVDGATRTVPPYTYGAVLKLNGATQAASARLLTPQNPFTTAPPIVANQAILTYSSEPAVNSAGTSLQASSIVGGVVNVNAGSVAISGGNVNVGDGGLAASTAAALSQLQHVADVPLAWNSTTTISIGAGTPTPYPGGSASWQVAISGLAGYTSRMIVKYYQAGNLLYQVVRDSCIMVGNLIATGPIHATTMEFDFIIPSGGTAALTAHIYTAGVILGDRWYDSAVYGSTGGQPSQGQGSMDGVLTGWQAATPANTQYAFQTLTYRGPVQVSAYQNQTPFHVYMDSRDYLGNVLTADLNLASSGNYIGPLVVWVPGTNNLWEYSNDSANVATSYFEVRAIDDLQ